MQLIRNKTFLQFALTLGLVGLVFAFHTPRVEAAACVAPATNYGSVTSTVTIPATATYRVWSRIQIPSSANNSYLLEIDGTTCYTVGGNSAVAINTWTWVDYQGGATTNKINASLTAGSHNIKMIGNSDGVMLDRIIFTQDTTGSACNPPTGTGDSCANPADTTAPVTSITSPIAGATVSGTTTISANATDDSGTVSKVEFYVDNVLKNTDTSSPYSYSWNTTTATAGSHSLSTKAYDAASPANVGISSTVSVNVSNSSTPKPGDANGDNAVNILDLSILASNYNQSGRTRSQGDFDGNGLVNILDLSILASNWGK